MALVIKYSLFALVATLTNIACQGAVNRLWHAGFEIYASMIAGTLAGLVVKYALDKKFIFSFRTRNLAQDASKFLLYSGMGILTTCVFWGMEMIFDSAFRTIPMRYTGAAIGLAVGYFLKYKLDKRFVFVESV